MNIDKRTRMYIVRGALILSIAFLMYNVFTKMGPEEKKVTDYMPKKPMVKIFDGGFENGGFVEVIDIVKGKFYQKKTIDTGTKGVAVYRVDKDGYKLVYRESETKKFKESYLDEELLLNLILLRNPIKEGISWINPDNSTYKILSINEKIKIMGKEIETIKLRYRSNNSEYYIYFAKGYGIVGVDTEMGNSRLKEVNYKVKDYLSNE